MDSCHLTYRNIYFLLLFHYSYSLYSDNKNHVIELTTENFDNLVVKGDEVWIVEFYAPWCVYCQNLAPEYIKTANALKGIIKVGAINADIHKELPGRYGVRGLPTIKIFGSNKFQPEDYNEARNSKQFIETALKAARAQILSRLSIKEQDGFIDTNAEYQDVIELTDNNFDKLVIQSNDIWMIDFYAHWCGHCKTLEPQWAAAAKLLKGKVKFGKIDGSVNKNYAMKYDVTAYPSIKLFPSNSKEIPVNYNGGRRSNDIIQWVNEKLKEDLTLPDIYQIVNEKSLRDACEEREFCIMTFLPNLTNCECTCRKSYLRMLRVIADKFKRHKWGWVWSESNSQPDLEKAFHIEHTESPAMTAINFITGIYILQAPFSEDGILEFLNDLVNGKGSPVYIDEDYIPNIYPVDRWNDMDGILSQENILKIDEEKRDEL